MKQDSKKTQDMWGADPLGECMPFAPKFAVCQVMSWIFVVYEQLKDYDGYMENECLWEL